LPGRSTRPLLAVDGDNAVHRAYHALPSSMKDGDGQPANAVVGFANALVRLWDDVQPRAVFVAFDMPTKPTYRHELLPGYQGGRDFVENAEFMRQLDRAPELAEAFGFSWAKRLGYEADDFLAAAVLAEEAAGGTSFVFSNDRDLFQLASERTTILRPRKAGALERIGPDEVRAIYAVEPSQVPDFVALRGDPSDRIPGASGIGAMKAAGVLREHGSLERALAAGRFAAEADVLRAYLQITTLQRDAPIPPIPDTEPNWARGAALAESWGLNGVARRLRERLDATGNGNG
jgi:DNA polymerase-1